MFLLQFFPFFKRKRFLDFCLILLIFVIIYVVGYHDHQYYYHHNGNYNEGTILTSVDMGAEAKGQNCFSSPPSSIRHQLLTFLSQSSCDRSRHYRTRMFFSAGTDWGELVSSRLVCLGTQTSLDRLYWLIPTLLNWSGPVSLSLFVTDLEFPLAVRYWEYLKRCEPRVAKQVSMHMTFPVDHLPTDNGNEFGDELNYAPCDNPRLVLENLLSHNLSPSFMSSWRDQLIYPQNLLRNLAKSGCQTNYTFIPDIDMIPKPGLDLDLEQFLKKRKDVSANAEGKETINCDKCAYVIPIFEIFKDVPRLPSNKSELIELVQKKKARQFHQTVYKINQKSSDLERWIQLKPVDDEIDVAYKVQKYIFKYEPLYVSRGDVPPFDERFVGYGNTRSTQVYEMYVAGYDFLVLDNAFTSHWGFQYLSSRPSWRVRQQATNNRRLDMFAKELNARYGRDPYHDVEAQKYQSIESLNHV